MNTLSSRSHMAELRSFFASVENPDADTWKTLCDLIDLAEDWSQFHEEVLHYIEGHIWQWPDVLKQCPSHWTNAYLQDDADPRILLAPHHLTLHRTSLNDANIQRLLQHQLDYPLASLSLRSCALNDEQTSELLTHLIWDDLTHLDLFNNHLGAQTWSTLKDQPLRHQLHHLNLSRGYPREFEQDPTYHPADIVTHTDSENNEGVLELLQGRFTNLYRLELYNRNIGNEGFNALSDTQMPQLRALNVGLNDITFTAHEMSAFERTAIETLQVSRYERLLSSRGASVHYMDNFIEEDAIPTLVRAAPNLKTLHAGFTCFEQESLLELLSGQCPHLETLTLQQNALWEVGPILRDGQVQLKHLNIAFCESDQQHLDTYLSDLAAAQLRTLDLSCNTIKRETIDALFNSPHLNTLDIVQLRYTGEEAFDALSQYVDHPKYTSVVLGAHDDPNANTQDHMYYKGTMHYREVLE